MLTARRRHDHWRVNQKYSEKIKWSATWQTWRLAKDQQDMEYRWWGVGWHNKRWKSGGGIGKYYKKRYNRAERRRARAECRGVRQKEPTAQLSDLKWRGT